MLHFAQLFRRFNHAAQALVVELIRSGARGTSAKNRAYRHPAVLLCYVLMDSIVGKTGKRAASAAQKDFQLLGLRKLPKALEDALGLFLD